MTVKVYLLKDTTTPYNYVADNKGCVEHTNVVSAEVQAGCYFQVVRSNNMRIIYPLTSIAYVEIDG